MFSASGDTAPPKRHWFDSLAKPYSCSLYYLNSMPFSYSCIYLALHLGLYYLEHTLYMLWNNVNANSTLSTMFPVLNKVVYSIVWLQTLLVILRPVTSSDPFLFYSSSLHRSKSWICRNMTAAVTITTRFIIAFVWHDDTLAIKICHNIIAWLPTKVSEVVKSMRFWRSGIPRSWKHFRSHRDIMILYRDVFFHPCTVKLLI